MHRMRSSAAAHIATTMTPVIMAMPVPLVIGPYNGTRGGPHCRAASASDCTADDGASHSATSRGALCHHICYGHGETQRQQE